jgi:hypothetical protein
MLLRRVITLLAQVIELGQGHVVRWTAVNSVVPRRTGRSARRSRVRRGHGGGAAGAWHREGDGKACGWTLVFRSGSRVTKKPISQISLAVEVVLVERGPGVQLGQLMGEVTARRGEVVSSGAGSAQVPAAPVPGASDGAVGRQGAHGVVEAASMGT